MDLKKRRRPTKDPVRKARGDSSSIVPEGGSEVPFKGLGV